MGRLDAARRRPHRHALHGGRRRRGPARADRPVGRDLPRFDGNSLADRDCTRAQVEGCDCWCCSVHRTSVQDVLEQAALEQIIPIVANAAAGARAAARLAVRAHASARARPAIGHRKRMTDLATISDRQPRHAAPRAAERPRGHRAGAPGGAAVPCAARVSTGRRVWRRAGAGRNVDERDLACHSRGRPARIELDAAGDAGSHRTVLRGRRRRVRSAACWRARAPASRSTTPPPAAWACRWCASFAASIDYERRDGRNHLTIAVARTPAA